MIVVLKGFWKFFYNLNILKNNVNFLDASYWCKILGLKREHGFVRVNWELIVYFLDSNSFSFCTFLPHSCLPAIYVHLYIGTRMYLIWIIQHNCWFVPQLAIPKKFILSPTFIISFPEFKTKEQFHFKWLTSNKVVHIVFGSLVEEDFITQCAFCYPAYHLWKGFGRYGSFRVM